MKRAITLPVLGLAMLLAGCTGEQEKCLTAVADANQVTKDRLEKQYVVMAKGLDSTDVAVKTTSQMWFALMEKSASLIDPTRCSDSTLAWAQLFLPTLTNVVGIVQNNKTARHASDNSVRMQEINIGTLGAVAVKGMEEAGNVVFPPVYTVPLGSAPAATAAPATP